MQQDHTAIKTRHEKFVKNVCETNIVYGLKSKDGFATSDSNDQEDEDGEPIGIICFWSEKALANACIKDDWAEYQVAEITLSEFIENWCIGMNNDNLLAGTNFDHNLSGFEIEPLELALELIKELKANKNNITLRKFTGLNDLEKQIMAANA